MIRRLLSLLCVSLLAACATRAPAPALLDLGPLPAVEKARLAPLALAEVEAPVALAGTAITYRLLYADAQQPRTYAYSRWTMPPAQLLDQRLRATLTAAGVTVAQATDGGGLPLVRIEVDDFSQHFTSAQQSEGRFGIRATIYRDRKLVTQGAFYRSIPAAADAAAGAHALREAADDNFRSLIDWLAKWLPAP